MRNKIALIRGGTLRAVRKPKERGAVKSSIAPTIAVAIATAGLTPVTAASPDLPANQIASTAVAPQISPAAAARILDRGTRLAEPGSEWMSFAKAVPVFAKATRKQNGKLENGPAGDVMSAFQASQKSSRG